MCCVYLELVRHWEFTINTVCRMGCAISSHKCCLSFMDQGEMTVLYNENKNCPLCWCSEKLVCHKIRMWQDETRWLWRTFKAAKFCFSCILFLMYDRIESYSGLWILGPSSGREFIMWKCCSDWPRSKALNNEETMLWFLFYGEISSFFKLISKLRMQLFSKIKMLAKKGSEESGAAKWDKRDGACGINSNN